MLYRIRDGERFVLPTGEIASAGMSIELNEDLAALHAARIEELPKVEASTEVPWSSKKI